MKVRAAVSLVVTLVLATTGVVSGQETTRAAATDLVVSAAFEAYAQLAAGNGPEADRMLRRLINSDELALVTEKLKREVYLLYSRSTQAVNGATPSYGVMVEVTGMASAQPRDWLLRMQLAQQNDEHEDAAASLAHVVKNWPEELRVLNSGTVAAVIDASLDEVGNDASYADLMAALVAADASAPLIELGLDPQWYRYVEYLLERGDMQGAVEAAGRIRYVPALIAMAIDRRFDALVAAAPALFDIAAAAEREVEFRRLMRTAHPALLSALVAESSTLMRVNRLDDALSLLDATMRPPNAARSATRTGWIDESEYLPWYLNSRADLLWRLGAFPQALGQLQEAKALPESGGFRNISQAINLANYLGRSGQAERALAALEDVLNVSAYGEMEILHVRVFAAVAADDAASLDSALTIMRRNRADSQRIYQHSLILSGRLDEAAAVLMQRLDGERSRMGALVEMQTYVEDSGSVPLATLDALYGERKRELLARPDVATAIDSVGRIMTFPTWYTAFQVYRDN